MGHQLNLLQSLKKPRNLAAISQRAAEKNPISIAVARSYGRQYFDGDRKYGYGGYRYDGRWMPVAQEIVKQYNLMPGDRVLDVGCAKGFLVFDLYQYGMEAFGLDISRYALRNCPPAVVGRLHRGSANLLPFPDASFDLALSINTLHNLDRDDCVIALRELQRVSRGPAFVQVDSYHTEEEKKLFEDWVLTAKFHDYPEGWLKVFEEAGYYGDYDWTVV